MLGDITNKKNLSQPAAKTNKKSTQPTASNLSPTPQMPRTPPGAEIVALPSSGNSTPTSSDTNSNKKPTLKVTTDTLESAFLAPDPPPRGTKKGAASSNATTTMRAAAQQNKQPTAPRVVQMPELAQALSPLADARPKKASGWDKGWEDIERFATTFTQQVGALGSALLDSPGGPASQTANNSNMAASAAAQQRLTMPGRAEHHAATQDANSEWDEFGIVEQSLDAINTMGRVALGIATTIDGAIEGSIEAVKKKMSPLKKLGARVSPKGKGPKPGAAEVTVATAAAATNESNGEKNTSTKTADNWDNWGTPVARAGPPRRKKAPAAASNAPTSVVPDSPDPLQEQMRMQVDALLREKARLAHENARLQRENDGLHELLQYQQHATVEDDDVCDEEAVTPEATVRAVSMLEIVQEEEEEQEAQVVDNNDDDDVETEQ